MINILLTDVFKALGDDNRIKIIKLLACCDMCVCDIMANLKLSQPAVSHHLKILNTAGIVTARREGKWIYYCLNRGKYEEIIDELERLYKKPDECPYLTHICDKIEEGNYEASDEED